MKGHRVLCVFILGLMVPYLDQTLESAPQEKWRFSALQHCDCPWFDLGNGRCPSAIPNCSSCHHTGEEWNWFEACYEKTTGYLRRTKALWRLGMNSVRQLGRVWQKLSEVILSCLAHCFDFYCVSCAVLGNSQILRASGAGNNYYLVIFRMNQAPVQGSDTDKRNQSTGPFVCPRNDSHQDSWGQQWLLPLSDLVWTSGALSDKESPFTITDSSKLMLFSECLSYCIQNRSSLEKTTLFRFGSELQRKWSRYWQNYNQTKGLQKDMSS